MKERPIIFSAPMVRAILSGAKTQTRRVVKPQPDYRYGVLFPQGSSTGYSPDLLAGACPFGRPGDRLWVRETWKHIEGGAIYDASGGTIDAFDPETIYRADRPNRSGPWISPIHMPRWASRITLEITDVRVERLQDISEADAVAEGVRRGDGKWHALDDCEAVFLDEFGWFAPERYTRHNAPRHAFREAWEIISGPGSWDANPWVWVIEFKKLEQQEQA